MKIAGGSQGIKKIKLNPKLKVRPSGSLLRGAIFDVLQNIICFEEAVFVDLFAGTGAVGIEALNRGFSKAIFVESDLKIIKILAQNLQLLDNDCYKLINKSTFWSFKIINKLTINYRHRVLFADPPYIEKYYEKLGIMLKKNKLLQIPTTLVLQSPKNMIIDQHNFGRPLLQRAYGRNQITIIDFNE